MKNDFVAFLSVLWATLGLPLPTRCQIIMAKMLSLGCPERFILMAFRGIGKSWITCALVVWLLWQNPQLKIMIVSASKERADANSVFIRRIIGMLPFLSALKPRKDQRDSTLSFDVGLAKPDHSPSVKSVGITGQLTGSRADYIIADDVEVPSNSATQGARDKLWELVKEFEAILKPLPTSKIIYLGTPQTEMTLYSELEQNRGYTSLIIPALYPRDANEYQYYGERLAVELREEYLENPELYQGVPTDPVRFDTEELLKREVGYGKAGFTLQFMLNPNLTDAEKYPLRLRDFIVAELDRETAALSYQWMPNPSNLLPDVVNVGLKGDSVHSYHSCDNRTASYLQKILVIDPSGRGKDETGWAVLYTLNGYIYLMDSGGMRNGYSDTTLEALAKKAKEWSVHTVVYESNFGDGMFGKVFSPVLLENHKCELEEFRSVGMKEMRICDTLEPVLAAHRLVARADVIRRDYQTSKDSEGKHDVRYSLFYQLTRISRERGALAHDDRLDALAIGVAFLKDTMEQNSKEGANELTTEFLEHEFERAVRSMADLPRMLRADCVDIQYETMDDIEGVYGSIFGDTYNMYS